MKKILALVLMLALVFTLGGCMYTTDELVINADGSGTSQTFIEVKKAAYDTLIQEMGGSGDVDLFNGEAPTVVNKDGEEYYQLKNEIKFTSLKELEGGLADGGYTDILVSENGVRFCADTGLTQADYDEMVEAYASLGVDVNSMVNCIMRIKMPKKIEAVSKNGTISADGYTAEFSLGMKDLIGYVEFMVSTAKEEIAPTISGVTDKKVYNKAISFKVSDPSGIESAVYQKNNGTAVAFDCTQKIKKNGTYTVTAKDYYGNEAVTTFKIKDTKKPTVTGVKNGKTYTGAKVIKFKDNCGVSKATLNGKKITSGKKISKKGSYKLVVTDVNGLKTTVAFKIK